MEAVNGVSEGDKGGPPPPSPLTGCYLLIVVAEPHSKDHKDVILQRLAKGLLSWDVNNCLVDLEKELAVITEQALEGEEARYGERLIQFASENLVTEVLIHPVLSTLAQCVRNLLSSFTRHRHIVHAGYTFAANGSWILQDGTFSYTDFAEAFQEIEVQRVIKAYENSIGIDIHCSPEGEWTRLPKESFTRGCNVRINPNDVLTSGTPSITSFINYLSPFLISTDIESLLESSDVVGNIRFSHPTLYIFPGGQGDAALFGINGFNMLLDGGFSRKACFWDFVRHLDRLDAVLLTRLNNSNVMGISSVLRRKRQNAVYPQIGHFFCNMQEKKALLSPDGDKDKDPLLINILEEGQEIISNLSHLNLTPQCCYRDADPVNLYHKVGHGTLDMYVLSPARDSKEVKEFLQKWNNNDQKLFTNQKFSKDVALPLPNLISICALLVWQPSNPAEMITRILFPGSCPQYKVFEGLDKLKQLEFIKHPTCSESTLASTASIIALKSKNAIEKLIASEQQKVLKKMGDNKTKSTKEDAKPKIMENNKKEHDPKEADVTNKTVKKSDSTESDKNIKTSKPKKTETDSAPMANGKIEDATNESIKSKIEPKPLRPKSEVQPKRAKPAEKKASPTTPKNTFESRISGDTAKSKIIGKSSPSSTPAKSTKDANNRKVVESKYKQVAKKEAKPEKKDAKVERKPVARRPKTSPLGKMPGSPLKKVNGIVKPDSLPRKARLDKEGTTDSSTVSTPSVDQDSVLKKDISKLTPEELENLKAQELAELKEDQEVVKEIEAVFQKGEHQTDKRTDLRKVKDISSEEKEPEEYLIIEKEEIEHIVIEDKSSKEDEIQKLTRDSEESEKQRTKTDDMDEKVVLALKPETIKVEDQALKGDSPKSKTETTGQQPSETPKEGSVGSLEDKVDIFSEKKSTERENEEENKEAAAPESQPEEKISATVESGATTTAPTLPEDERITLDEIKEDIGDQIIEEKHVKEETKEKDVPIVREPPKSFEPISKLPPVVGIRLDKQSNMRDVVKTPDEVADLPVHEEVDIDNYVDYQYKSDQLIEDTNKKSNEPKEKVTEPSEQRLVSDEKTMQKKEPEEPSGTKQIKVESEETTNLMTDKEAKEVSAWLEGKNETGIMENEPAGEQIASNEVTRMVEKTPLEIVEDEKHTKHDIAEKDTKEKSNVAPKAEEPLEHITKSIEIVNAVSEQKTDFHDKDVTVDSVEKDSCDKETKAETAPKISEIEGREEKEEPQKLGTSAVDDLIIKSQIAGETVPEKESVIVESTESQEVVAITETSILDAEKREGHQIEESKQDAPPKLEEKKGIEPISKEIPADITEKQDEEKLPVDSTCSEHKATDIKQVTTESPKASSDKDGLEEQFAKVETPTTYVEGTIKAEEIRSGEKGEVLHELPESVDKSIPDESVKVTEDANDLKEMRHMEVDDTLSHSATVTEETQQATEGEKIKPVLEPVLVKEDTETEISVSVVGAEVAEIKVEDNVESLTSKIEKLPSPIQEAVREKEPSSTQEQPKAVEKDSDDQLNAKGREVAKAVDENDKVLMGTVDEKEITKYTIAKEVKETVESIPPVVDEIVSAVEKLVVDEIHEPIIEQAKVETVTLVHEVEKGEKNQQSSEDLLKRIEDTIIRNEKEIEAVKDKYDEKLVSEIKKGDEVLEEGIKAAEQEITTLEEHVDDIVKTSKHEIEDIQRDIDRGFNEIKQETRQAIDRVDEISNDVKEVEKHIDDVVKETRHEAQELQDHVKKVVEEVKQETDKVKEQIDEAAMEVKHDIKHAEKQVDGALEETTQELKEIKEHVDEKVQKLLFDVKEVGKHIEGIVKETQKEAKQFQDQINEAVQEVKQETTKVKEHIDKTVTEFKDATHTEKHVKDAADTLVGVETAMGKNISKDLEQIRQLQEHIGESVKQQIDEKVKQISLNVEEAEKHMDDVVEETHQEMKKTEDHLNEYVQEKRQEIETQMDKLLSGAETLTDIIGKKANELCQKPNLDHVRDFERKEKHDTELVKEVLQDNENIKSVTDATTQQQEITKEEKLENQEDIKIVSEKSSSEGPVASEKKVSTEKELTPTAERITSKEDKSSDDKIDAVSEDGDGNDTSKEGFQKKVEKDEETEITSTTAGSKIPVASEVKVSSEKEAAPSDKLDIVTGDGDTGGDATLKEGIQKKIEKDDDTEIISTTPESKSPVASGLKVSSEKEVVPSDKLDAIAGDGDGDEDDTSKTGIQKKVEKDKESEKISTTPGSKSSAASEIKVSNEKEVVPSNKLDAVSGDGDGDADDTSKEGTRKKVEKDKTIEEISMAPGSKSPVILEIKVSTEKEVATSDKLDAASGDGDGDEDDTLKERIQKKVEKDEETELISTSPGSKSPSPSEIKVSSEKEMTPLDKLDAVSGDRDGDDISKEDIKKKVEKDKEAEKISTTPESKSPVASETKVSSEQEVVPSDKLDAIDGDGYGDDTSKAGIQKKLEKDKEAEIVRTSPGSKSPVASEIKVSSEKEMAPHDKLDAVSGDRDGDDISKEDIKKKVEKDKEAEKISTTPESKSPVASETKVSSEKGVVPRDKLDAIAGDGYGDDTSKAGIQKKVEKDEEAEIVSTSPGSKSPVASEIKVSSEKGMAPLDKLDAVSGDRDGDDKSKEDIKKKVEKDKETEKISTTPGSKSPVASEIKVSSEKEMAPLDKLDAVSGDRDGDDISKEDIKKKVEKDKETEKISTTPGSKSPVASEIKISSEKELVPSDKSDAIDGDGYGDDTSKVGIQKKVENDKGSEQISTAPGSKSPEIEVLSEKVVSPSGKLGAVSEDEERDETSKKGTQKKVEKEEETETRSTTSGSKSPVASETKLSSEKELALTENFVSVPDINRDDDISEEENLPLHTMIESSTRGEHLDLHSELQASASNEREKDADANLKSDVAGDFDDSKLADPKETPLENKHSVEHREGISIGEKEIVIAEEIFDVNSVNSLSSDGGMTGKLQNEEGDKIKKSDASPQVPSSAKTVEEEVKVESSIGLTDEKTEPFIQNGFGGISPEEPSKQLIDQAKAEETSAKVISETKTSDAKEGLSFTEDKSDISGQIINDNVHVAVTDENGVKETDILIQSVDYGDAHTLMKQTEIIDKAELGSKSPKEREEDVAKIVASVAEVLKSDAPLEEFEGKIPLSTLPLTSFTTELRETHITTVDSLVTDIKEPKAIDDVFIEQERKMSAQSSGDKINSLIRDSNELMEATSKMISSIKSTKPESEADSQTVHKMLVTASSEDGGEETVICPSGTIKFAKSSESSGRSSPDDKIPSKKSSITDSEIEQTEPSQDTVKEKDKFETSEKDIHKEILKKDAKIEIVSESKSGDDDSKLKSHGQTEKTITTDAQSKHVDLKKPPEDFKPETAQDGLIKDTQLEQESRDIEKVESVHSFPTESVLKDDALIHIKEEGGSQTNVEATLAEVPVQKETEISKEKEHPDIPDSSEKSIKASTKPKTDASRTDDVDPTKKADITSGSATSKSPEFHKALTSAPEQVKPVVETTEIQRDSKDIKDTTDYLSDPKNTSEIPALDLSSTQPSKASVSDFGDEKSGTAGPSSAIIVDSSSSHLTSPKISTEDLHLSGKSTPDIADVEKIKELQEILEHEKHIPGKSTPPTVPASPIIKEKESVSEVSAQRKESTKETELSSMEAKTITTIKEWELRSSTPGSDDFEHSDISSGQMSRAPNLYESERIDSDEDDIPGSPTSITSQVVHSHSSSHYDLDDDSIKHATKIDVMNVSMYGSLQGESADMDFEKAVEDHLQARGENLERSKSPTYLHEITKAKFSSKEVLESETGLASSGSSKKVDLMTSSFIGTELPSETHPKDVQKDPIASWGKPLGLPSPAPPNENKGTPKKERKIPPHVSAKNKLNDDRKRSESPSKYDRKQKKVHPIYVDLTYVPHNGNSNYSFVDFFKRIRARYYVFSGVEPSREVYDALLEAKQTWENKDLEVTIIPTYDTDILGYWVAENEDLLTKFKIDLSPSASRCTINLQDHETSCSAYRLEF